MRGIFLSPCGEHDCFCCGICAQSQVHLSLRIEEAIDVCAPAQVHPPLRVGRVEEIIDDCACAQVHPSLRSGRG